MQSSAWLGGVVAGRRRAWATHPLLSRLGDVPVGLEEPAQVQGLAAPEIAVDAPVEGELQRLPVKAPAWVRQSVCQLLRAAAAYRTCFLELMATAARAVVCAAEAGWRVCGRNASWPPRCCARRRR